MIQSTKDYLRTHMLPEDIHCQNNPVFIKEIELLVNNFLPQLPTTATQQAEMILGPVDYTKHLKNITSTL